MALELTPEGIIKSGRYAGHHIDELADFAESLEDAGLQAKPEAKAEARPEPKPGEAALAERSGTRLDAFQNLTVSTATRLEQDDEEAFAATVSDYEKYKPQITKAKKNLTPQQRTYKGLHKNLYLGARMQEKDVQDKVLNLAGSAESEPEPEGEAEAPPKEEVKEPEAKKPELEKVKPRAVAPISAKPTPSGREASPKERQAKLRDTNGKLARVASAMGMGLAQYLLQLEDRGVTQDTLDKETQTRTEGAGATRRSKVYGG